MTASQGVTTKRRLRFSLGQLFVLITALAIGLAVYRTRQELTHARMSVASMRALARELKVEDPSRVTAINRLPTSPDEMILDVHVPRANSDTPNRLCLALEGILGHGIDGNYPQPVDTLVLEPGRHKIEIRHLRPASSGPDEEHTVKILVDDQTAMRATRPGDWMPASSWTGTGSITESRSFSPDEPAELHRRRFNEKLKAGSRSKSGEVPANGILLWIDRPPS